MSDLNTTFNNEFDLTERDLSEISIKETFNKSNCYIWDTKNTSIAYNSFVLTKNSKTKTICELNFNKSSETNKYLPRIKFKRINLEGLEQVSKSDRSINIAFTSSKDAIILWEFIGFLSSYKELVDLGEFEKSLKVVPKNSYIIEFTTKSEKEKFEDLKELIKIADFNSKDIDNLILDTRRKSVRTFFHLLKNTFIQNENTYIMDAYKKKYNLRGDESVWQHFLIKNNWLLGLNIDIKFIEDFIDEAKVGIEDTTGSGSPIVDFIGLSNYTVLVELKTAKTKIFKDEKKPGDGSRANTWAFSSDFINGISQSLAQKTDWDKNAKQKDLIKDGFVVDQEIYRTLDPKTIFLIGNRKSEFPHNKNVDNNLKSETFERFRRDSRNIDIITFDELFERAYHLVFSKELDKDWYEKSEKELLIEE